MATKEIRDGFFEIDGRVRAERGLRRVEGVADEATLSDEFTASHYQVGGRDAAGQPIVAGQKLTYLDYREKHGPQVWYIYKLTAINDPDDTRDDVWTEVAVIDGDQDAALAEAKKHVKD